MLYVSSIVYFWGSVRLSLLLLLLFVWWEGGMLFRLPIELVGVLLVYFLAIAVFSSFLD